MVKKRGNFKVGIILTEGSLPCIVLALARMVDLKIYDKLAKNAHVLFGSKPYYYTCTLAVVISGSCCI